MRILFYLVAIIAANVITASCPSIHLGIFIVPWGTFLVGATFVLRDLVQVHHGRRTAYAAILTALVLSAATSYLLGDTLWIVLASGLSFAISETSDTEMFTRLRASFAARVLWSGIVGGLIDSLLFVVIGLSPLGAGMIPWAAVPSAILGQLLVKTALQVVGVGVLRLAHKPVSY